MNDFLCGCPFRRDEEDPRDIPLTRDDLEVACEHYEGVK